MTAPQRSMSYFPQQKHLEFIVADIIHQTYIT